MTVVLCALAGACADAPVTVLERIAPTYYEDVTPILARHCWCCHQAGGQAHTLTALAEVQAELGAVVADIDARTMPPAARASGRSCGEAWLSGGLSAEERGILEAWIDGGQPRGFEDAAAPVPARCSVHSGEVHPVEVAHRPDRDSPEALCFPLSDPSLTGAYVTGLNVDASSPVVRNVVLWSVAGSPSVPADGEGDPCRTEDPVGRMVAAWSADAGGALLPAGLGVKVVGNLWARIATDPVFAPDAGEVVTTLEIGLRDAVETEALWTTVSVSDLELPARTAEAVVEETAELMDDFRLYAVSAMTNHLATRVTLSVAPPGGEPTCIAEIDPWPRAGFGTWLLSEPLSLSQKDRLGVRCRYDTSERDHPVPAGDAAGGEVCAGMFLVAP